METHNKTTYNLPKTTTDMINEIFCHGIMEKNKITKTEIISLAIGDFYKKYKEITNHKNVFQQLRKS